MFAVSISLLLDSITKNITKSMPPKNEIVTSKPNKKEEAPKRNSNSMPTQREGQSKKDSAKEISNVNKNNLPAATTAESPVPKDWNLHNFSMYGFDETGKSVEYNSTYPEEFRFVSTEHAILLIGGGLG